jgi:hypothetical protein
LITPPLIAHLLSLPRRLKGIAVSHPHVRLSIPDYRPVCQLDHLALLPSKRERLISGIIQFFTTSLTWSRALQIPLYLCSADKQWLQRLEDIHAHDRVVWWDDMFELARGLKLIQCGGSVCFLLSTRNCSSEIKVISQVPASYTGIDQWNQLHTRLTLDLEYYLRRIQSWYSPLKRALRSYGLYLIW